jgi:hypothetical protein
LPQLIIGQAVFLRERQTFAPGNMSARNRPLSHIPFADFRIFLQWA